MIDLGSERWKRGDRSAPRSLLRNADQFGAETESQVASDNKKALVALERDQSMFPKGGSLAAVIGSASALGIVGFVAATLGAKSNMFRKPWYARLLRS